MSASPATVVPVLVPAARAMAWLIGAVFLAFAVYYFIGVDQGATSIFGDGQMGVHEFVHDARHFLGFPCH